MTIEQKEAIEKLTSLNLYFESNAVDNILFAHEYHVSIQIQKIIENKTIFLTSDLEKTTAIFNIIEDHEHYDGSGWNDYKLVLSHLFKTFGYHLLWDRTKKTIVTFESF